MTNSIFAAGFPDELLNLFRDVEKLRTPSRLNAKCMNHMNFGCHAGCW